jgi:hypothetical protein
LLPDITSDEMSGVYLWCFITMIITKVRSQKQQSSDPELYEDILALELQPHMSQ